MAMLIKRANPIIPAGAQAVCPTTMGGVIETAIVSVAGTVNSAAEILRPLSITNANNVLVKLGFGAKVFFRVKYSQAESLSTNVVVQPIGIFTTTEPTEAQGFADDGTIEFCRLDALSGAATPISLAETAATDKRDTTWRYSDWVTFTSPFTGVVGDAAGASWLLLLMTTAGVVSGAGTASVEVLVVN